MAITTFLIFSQSSDFRNLKWGMSFEKVKTVESAPLIHESYDKLVYEDDQLIIPHVDLENREFVLVP